MDTSLAILLDKSGKKSVAVAIGGGKYIVDMECTFVSSFSTSRYVTRGFHTNDYRMWTIENSNSGAKTDRLIVTPVFVL